MRDILLLRVSRNLEVSFHQLTLLLFCKSVKESVCLRLEPIVSYPEIAALMLHAMLQNRFLLVRHCAQHCQHFTQNVMRLQQPSPTLRLSTACKIGCELPWFCEVCPLTAKALNSFSLLLLDSDNCPHFGDIIALFTGNISNLHYKKIQG